MSYTVNDTVVWTAIGDEVRMYDMTAGSFRTLNATAALIWNRIADGQEVDEVGADLAAAHGGGDPQEEQVIAGDVRRFVDALVAEEILTPKVRADSV